MPALCWEHHTHISHLIFTAALGLPQDKDELGMEWWRVAQALDLIDLGSSPSAESCLLWDLGRVLLLLPASVSSSMN